MRRVSEYKIDQAYNGEIPRSSLSPFEQERLQRLGTGYSKLSQPLSKLKPQYMGPLQRRLHGFLNGLSIKSIFLVSLVVSGGIVMHPKFKTSESARPKFQHAPQIAYVNSSVKTSSEVRVFRGGNSVKPTTLKIGDQLEFSLGSRERGAYHVAVLTRSGEDFEFIYPKLSNNNKKVLLNPNWKIPYRYLVTSKGSHEFFVLVSKSYDVLAKISELKASLNQKSAGSQGKFPLVLCEQKCDVHRIFFQ